MTPLIAGYMAIANIESNHRSDTLLEVLLQIT